jgi:hypothetical protein
MTIVWAGVVAALALLTGCSKPAPPQVVHKLGDRVESGPLIYTVFEAEWTAQIGSGEHATVPAHRFLVVHLSVTNSGTEAVSIPSLTLVDDAGQPSSEAVVGADLPALLGLSRTIKPVETRDGRVLFDVEPKSYKLKLDDVSDSGKSALVEMPLHFALTPSGIAGGTATQVPPK